MTLSPESARSTAYDVSATDFAGATTTYLYYADHYLKSILGPSGAVVKSFVYAALGRLSTSLTTAPGSVVAGSGTS